MVKNLATILCAFAVVASIQTRSEAAVIGFPGSVTTRSFAVGDIVDVPLVVSGLANTPVTTMGAFDVTISFSSLVLELQDVAFGDPVAGDQLDLSGLDLPALGLAGWMLAGNSVVNLFELSLDPSALLVANQLDAFTMATLKFKAIAPGKSVLDIQDLVSFASDADGFDLAPIWVDGKVSVPEPSTLMLIVPGLAWLVRRRYCRMA